MSKSKSGVSNIRIVVDGYAIMIVVLLLLQLARLLFTNTAIELTAVGATLVAWLLLMLGFHKMSPKGAEFKRGRAACLFGILMVVLQAVFIMRDLKAGRILADEPVRLCPQCGCEKYHLIAVPQVDGQRTAGDIQHAAEAKTVFNLRKRLDRKDFAGKTRSALTVQFLHRPVSEFNNPGIDVRRVCFAHSGIPQDLGPKPAAHYF